MYDINFDYNLDVKKEDIIKLLMRHLLIDDNILSKNEIDILKTYINLM